MARVSVIDTSSLGDRSYLVSDGEVAVVVDPQRDVDRVLDLAGRLGVRIGTVVETHLHNDYVSGGLELARLTGARYLLAGADDVTFDRVPLADGDLVPVSERIRLRVVATPGHTFHHLSYLLDERADDGTWHPVGVFTGGSLLFGTSGRTDLLGAEHAEPLARAQYASARRLADLLPDGARVWPTHGFGSFCATAPADVAESTLGRERRANPALRLAEDDFVTETLAGLDAFPAYYAHVGMRNTAGAAPVDLTPARPVDPDTLRRQVAAGQWVVDLRHRHAYAAGHLGGTVSLGLDGSMATWLGWLLAENPSPGPAPQRLPAPKRLSAPERLSVPERVDDDTLPPVTLLAENPEQIAQAQRELVRVGVDRPAGAAVGPPERWVGSGASLRRLPVADFTALANFGTPADIAAPSAVARPGHTRGDLPAPDVVLDVRLGNEWREGHVAGAVHVPLFALPHRLDAVPPGTVWVHCSTGYRAAAAAALLANAGRRVVLIDDEYAGAADAGVSVVRAADR